MEPIRSTVGIGLRIVGKHWCMTKVDSNMKVVDLPLFYKTEKNTYSIGACSSIDGEFIWVYGTGGGDLFVGCIRENGVWQSNSDEDAIGLRRVEIPNRINRGLNSHFAWVTESGNFCITNERHRYRHEMDNEDPDKPDIVVYQITPEFLRIQGEYILADHRDAKKIIGRFEFYSYWAGATLNRRRMRCKGTGVEFENVWECPDDMDYIVEYPESKIEFDE